MIEIRGYCEDRCDGRNDIPGLPRFVAGISTEETKPKTEGGKLLAEAKKFLTPRDFRMPLFPPVYGLRNVDVLEFAYRYAEVLGIRIEESMSPEQFNVLASNTAREFSTVVHPELMFPSIREELMAEDVIQLDTSGLYFADLYHYLNSMSLPISRVGFSLEFQQEYGRLTPPVRETIPRLH